MKSHRDVQNKTKKIQELLEKIETLLSTGAKTIRRIFYMLGSNPSYSALGKHLVWARLHNIIDWDKIIEAGLQKYIDMEKFNEILRQEEKDQERLEEIREKLTGV